MGDTCEGIGRLTWRILRGNHLQGAWKHSPAGEGVPQVTSPRGRLTGGRGAPAGPPGVTHRRIPPGWCRGGARRAGEGCASVGPAGPPWEGALTPL